MDLEIIILSKSKKDEDYMIISYTQIFKNNTNESIHKTGSQIQKTNLYLPRRIGRGVWN